MPGNRLDEVHRTADSGGCCSHNPVVLLRRAVSASGRAGSSLARVDLARLWHRESPPRVYDQTLTGIALIDVPRGFCRLRRGWRRVDEEARVLRARGPGVRWAAARRASCGIGAC